ncbi:MAG: hypothetical protein ACRED5_10765 [Propylenella sp.]
MSTQFQSIIEAGVRRAKARKSVIWADEFARRIVSSTPLTVRESDISEQIVREAARAGVAIEFAQRRDAIKASCTAQ